MNNDTVISDYISIGDNNNNSLYFMLVESRSRPTTDPLIIWLQGGPGCSSMLAFFTENGPYNWHYTPLGQFSKGTMDYNPYSWNQKANVMYVDQPLGTGFSKASFLDLRWSLETIANDFRAFMVGFLAKYPAFNGRDIYLTGESYAGHYIPMFANHLYYNPVPGLTIAGIALGNAWVDPFYQYTASPVFAVQNNLIDWGHYYLLLGLFSVCQMSLIIEVPLISNFICQFAGVSIASPLPSFNIYDIREPCVTFGLCYPDDKLAQVMNSEDYQGQFMVKGEWEVCADLPHLTLMSDFNRNLGYKLAPLLDSGMPVLIYNGDKDYICNTVGA
jgi:cathepsin A (carboxypeptidase C)